MRPEAEALRATLTRIRELSARSDSKHEQIRIRHWLRALLAQPTSNATWLRNALEYASALLQMLLDGTLREPFDRLPPQGPLPTLPRHTSARAAVRAAGKRSGTANARLSDDRQSQARGDNNRDAAASPVQMRMQSQHVQTRESEDQYEWQRVWKAAFERMRRDLDERTQQTRALELEVKELRAVRSGLEQALEREQQTSTERQLRHNAELANLRAVHDLELQALKAQHRKAMYEVRLQNEHELQRRRRNEQQRSVVVDDETGSADAVDDFLAFIDMFRLETLALTMSQSQL